MWTPLLERVPGFQSVREAFLAKWASEGEPLPEYICTNELANFVVGSYETQDFATVQSVFEVVDIWLRDGDDDVVDLAVVGFIEDLSVGDVHKTTSPEDFERFMSPEVKVEWENLIAAWIVTLGHAGGRK